MMYTPEQTLKFTMPITLQDHQVANEFRQQQPNRQKAKQVYLNTIAVQVVNSYLKCFGIATDLAASDSWNPTLQLLMDVADLVIQPQGKLECRPVLPHQEVCWVPPEVWSDRIGFIAVQLNAELTEAELVGFLPAINQTEVPLTAWRSLDELLEYLIPSTPVLVTLSQWLQGVVDSSWHTLDTLFNVPQPVLVMRGIEGESKDAPTHTTRGKILHIKSGNENTEVALLVELLATELEALQITVKLCPYQENTMLPIDLDVMVLDELGTPVMQAQSRNTDMIQLQFRALPQEKFSVKVISEAMSVTEDFVV